MDKPRSKLTRRTFLWRSSVAAGVAGAVASVPGLPVLLATDAPAATEAGPEAASVLPDEAAALSEPLVAHVRDLSTGAMDIYVGDQQVAYTNRQLAALLYRAAKP
jgi:hypothetical protein